MPLLKQSKQSDLCLCYGAWTNSLLIKLFIKHLVPKKGPLRTLYMKICCSFTIRVLHNSLHFKKYIMKPSHIKLITYLQIRL